MTWADASVGRMEVQAEFAEPPFGQRICHVSLRLVKAAGKPRILGSGGVRLGLGARGADPTH